MTVLVLSAGMIAQSPPTPCPADRPVDEIIAETNKQSRHKNPVPNEICIWGWCRGSPAKTPPTLPQAAPPVEMPAGENTSSSKPAADKCNQATELALEAAHNVEVGDYYFKGKNYGGALLRYQEAVKQKARDAAIHVRLGRVHEKLSDSPHAMEHYQAAEKLAGPPKWSQEARRALLRLQRTASARSHIE